MRNVIRSYKINDAPKILQLTSTIDDCTKIAKAGNASDIKPHVYSDPYMAAADEGNQSRVVEKLNEWYHGKCAYCERFYKLDVEHFRPKGEIRGEDNKVIRTTGYYWLCYEWSNLLPSCISCNRDGGKFAKFPYLAGGKQVTAPVFDTGGKLDRVHCMIDHHSLIGELPALLHPETDLNIENYFTFEIDTQKQGIAIKGTDTNRRGEITAIVCKLNRPEIRKDRLQNVVMDLVGSIHNSIAKLNREGNPAAFASELKLYFEKIQKDCNQPKLSHTLLRKHIVKSTQNFDAIVVPFIEPGFQAVLSHAFKQYLIKNAILAGIATPIPKPPTLVVAARK